MNIKHTYKHFLAILSGIWGILYILSIVSSSYLFAANKPELIKKFNEWAAYQYLEGNSKVCFMASSPTSKKGKYNTRGEVYALITHRPSEKTKDVVSFVAGYTYKTNSEVTINIDGKKFKFFTQGDTAWGADTNTDHRLTQAILKGNKMVVTGTSSRGTLTTDTFSLKGAGNAYKEISKACKM